MKKTTFFKTLLVAVGLCAGSMTAWAATYTTAYNKALTADVDAGITAWESTDISATEWVVSDGESNMGASIESGAGLVLSIQSNTTGSNSVTKTFSAVPSDGIVMFEVNWYPYRTYDAKGYSYIQFGDRFRLTTGYNYNANAPLYVNYNGTSSNATQLLSTLTTASHSIVVKMNCKNKEILQFTIDGTDYTSNITTTLTGSAFNTLTIGANKGTANSWNNNQWYCALSTVKVSYLPNAVNVWNFLDTNVWGKYTSSGASDNFKVSATGSEVWFAPDGSSATSETSNVSFKFEEDKARFNYGGTRGLGYGKNYDSTNDINFVKINIPANFQVIVNYTLGSTGRPLVFNLAGATESKTASGTYTYTNETGAAVTLKMYETNSKNDYQTTCIKDIKLIDTENAESYGYTVNAVDAEGNVLKTLGTGNAMPYNNYSVTGIPYVISYGGSYYELSDAAASNLSETFTMGEKSVVNTVNYALKNDIALFQEYESLNANGGRINAWDKTSASNGKGAFIGYTSGTATTTATSNSITTTGVYDIIVRACDRSGKTETKKIYLTDGKTDTEIGTLSSSNSSSSWATTTISNVLITSGQYLKLLTNTASANDTFVGDYILVRKKYDVTDVSKIVGAVDYSTTANGANSSDYTLKKGETKVFTFQNHGQDYGKNWRISVKEGETWKANVCADSYDYTANGETKVSYKVSKDGGSSIVALDWTEFQADMADARVVATLAYGTNGTLAITTTSTGAANDYIYYVDQDVTGLTGDLTINLSVNESWLEVLSVETTAIETTIGATGYSTFASPYALDLDHISGATAYYVSSINNGYARLTQATGNVAAGTGLILKGTAGETVTIPVVAEGNAIAGNMLVGCPSNTPVEASATTYVLAINNGEAEFQYLDAALTIPAGKAYLNAAAGGGAKLRIVFPGDASGIEEIATDGAEDDVLYNVAGQQVSKNYKGIVIDKKGQKYFNK